MGVDSVLAQETSGKVVFTWDDGYRVDYTRTFPIFQREDVPACIGTPSQNIDRGPDFLTRDQVAKMSEAGWEVMSHGRTHEALGSVAVTAPVEAEDERVYVDSTVHARTPAAVEIYTADDQAVVELTGEVGEDGTGAYLEVASTVGTAFSTEADPRLRFTEDVVRATLEESKQELRDHGWNTRNIVLPYDRWDERTLRLIPEYYDAVANVYQGGINGGAASDPYRLKRTYFTPDHMSDGELGSFFDQVAQTNGLAILGGHTRTQTGERTETAIQMAKERDLDIVTLQTALEEFDIVEPPSPTPTETDTTTPSGGTPASNESNDDDDWFPLVDALLRWLNKVLGTVFG